MLKTWFSTPATVDLSSAKAELYALTKGAAPALGLMALLAVFGVEGEAAVHTDASAAIGIAKAAASERQVSPATRSRRSGQPSAEPGA